LCDLFQSDRERLLAVPETGYFAFGLGSPEISFGISSRHPPFSAATGDNSDTETRTAETTWTGIGKSKKTLE
jgi:hypothetical protein